MTISKKVLIIIAAVAALFIGIICKIAYEEHEAFVQADENSRKYQATIDTYQKSIADRVKTDIQQHAVSEAAQAKVKTSADAVKIITQYVPVSAAPEQKGEDLPAQAVVLDRKEFSDAAASKLPESPAYVVQTEAQSTAVAKDLIACEADRSSLNVCKLNMSDMQGAIDAQKKETDTWKAAAKGGTKTQRFVKFLKCAGFAGVGAAGGAFTKQPLWAGVGAGAGVAACQLF